MSEPLGVLRVIFAVEVVDEDVENGVQEYPHSMLIQFPDNDTLMAAFRARQFRFEMYEGEAMKSERCPNCGIVYEPKIDDAYCADCAGSLRDSGLPVSLTQLEERGIWPKKICDEIRARRHD